MRRVSDSDVFAETERLLRLVQRLPLSVERVLDHQFLLEQIADLWASADLRTDDVRVLERVGAVNEAYGQACRRIDDFVRSPEAGRHAIAALARAAGSVNEICTAVIYPVYGSLLYGFGDAELRIALHHLTLRSARLPVRDVCLVRSPQWLYDLARSPRRRRLEEALAPLQRLEIGSAMPAPCAEVVEVLVSLWSPQEGPYADLDEALHAARALV